MAISDNPEEKLWNHLKSLRDNSDAPKELEKYWSYYLGDFSSKDFNKLENTCNIIKQIVDTKATLALDAMMTSTVVPAPVEMAEIQTLQELQDVADLLDDSLKTVMRENNADSIKAQVMDDGLIFGLGVCESVWDAEAKVQGDVKSAALDPRKIRVEKSAINFEDSAYVFIDQELSIYELKKRYAVNSDGSISEDMVAKIDAIATTNTPNKEKKDPTGIMSYNSDAGGGQAYAYGQDGIKNAGKTVKLWRVYLKDDSTFIQDEQSEDDTTIQTLAMQYPNGRYVVMSAKDANKIIFEDKAIDYPFGYPLSSFTPYKHRMLFGKSEVQDLMYVQDRINKAYIRLQTLIAKFVSIIMYDSAQLDLTEDDFVNGFAMAIDNMRTNGTPSVLTNNTLSEINSVIEYIQQLKAEAKEIARVNDIMIAGSTPTQVKSGVAIEALMESPQASIRGIQRAFKEFMIDWSKKCIVLIQKYYNTPRIVSLSEGRFAILNAEMGPDGTQVGTSAKFIDNGKPEEKGVKNLQVGEFGVEIVAGTEVPRSRSEQAQLMTQLVSQGMLGDMNNLEIKEQYFRAIDLPNYRAIMDVLKKQQEAANKAMSPPTDKISASIKDLPDWIQVQWAAKNGYEVPEQLQNLLPPPPPQAMPDNNIAGLPQEGV